MTSRPDHGSRPSSCRRRSAGPAAAPRAAGRSRSGRRPRAEQSAKTAAESGCGWHSQITSASGVSSATVRPLASIVCRSIGTAVLAEQPVAARLEQDTPARRRRPRVLDAVAGEGLAGADLDADVRAVQPAERVLVGHVVADEHRRRRADLVPQHVERVALVGRDHRELDDLLALGDLYVPALRRPACAFVSAASPSAGSALRTCTATLAGLTSRRRRGTRRRSRSARL